MTHMMLHDHYLTALGITQWVPRETCDEAPITWCNRGGIGGAFAFIIDEAYEPHAILLNNMIKALGQDISTTLIYTCNTEPDGLPLLTAKHVIVLGYGHLRSGVPTAYYCAPSLSALQDDPALKRALWLAMKQMMDTDA